MTKQEREEFIVKNEFDYRLFTKALYVIGIITFILLGVVLINGIFGSAYPLLSGTDITYNFQTDNFYTTTIEDNNYTTTYNTREQQYYTGNYQGIESFDSEFIINNIASEYEFESFDFTGETSETGTNIDFVDTVNIPSSSDL